MVSTKRVINIIFHHGCLVSTCLYSSPNLPCCHRGQSKDEEAVVVSEVKTMPYRGDKERHCCGIGPNTFIDTSKSNKGCGAFLVHFCKTCHTFSAIWQ